MTEIYNNAQGGILTLTPEQHVPVFDFDVLPSAPQTQVVQGPVNPDQKRPQSIRSKYKKRTTTQDYAFAIGVGIAGSILLTFLVPDFNYTDTSFWVVTAAISAFSYFAQNQFDQ